jgi:hypothetical protein
MALFVRHVYAVNTNTIETYKHQPLFVPWLERYSRIHRVEAAHNFRHAWCGTGEIIHFPHQLAASILQGASFLPALIYATIYPVLNIFTSSVRRA